MEHIPQYLELLFIGLAAISVYLIYRAAGNNKTLLTVLLLWCGVIGFIAATGFLRVYDTVPPRFVLVMLPPVLTITFLFTTSRGKRFLDALNLKWLTGLQTIRIFIEIGLFLLFVHKAVPELMTFEGRNFDILTGLTTPLVFYLVFVKKIAGREILLAWNIIGLALACFIVGNAILAAPTVLQQIAFDQPNKAVFYFPFVWLPATIVPICILSHLASIRKLMMAGKTLPLLQKG